MAEHAATATPPAKAGRGKLPIILAVVASLAAGGGGAYYWLHRQPAGKAEAEKPARHKAAAEGGGIVSFEPFVVNLADPGRFLRVSVRLVVGEPEEAEVVQKNEVTVTRLRSAIIDILTERTSDELVTPDGKKALKKAIEERATPLLEPTELSDVLFSDFVVQF